MVTSDDLVLLLETLHFSGRIEGRKRFQKIICILKHQYHIPFEFTYVPYFYGPYSEDLADSIQTLIGSGYVNEEANEIGMGVYQYTYSLTQDGIAVVDHVLTNHLTVANIQPEHLQTLVNTINPLHTTELVTMSKQLNLESEITV